MQRIRLLGVLGVLFAAAVITTSGGTAVFTPSGTVVMSGLLNPRGLAVDHHGSVYVAESGAGGAAPCAVFSDMLTKCYGPTGRVSRLRDGVQEVVAAGLPSNAPAGGNGANGPENIALQGGHLYVTNGLGANPNLPSIAPFRVRGQGRLFKVHPDPRRPSRWAPEADIAAFEGARNPVGVPDSNPYGLFGSGGHRFVTDAGGNDLLEVHGNHVELVATFPSRPERSTDAVPTTVTRGPDGDFYVGELSGAPFNVGEARVYRVANGEATVHCSGFTAVISIAFGPDGRLYVLQFATAPGLTGPGILYRVDPGCTKAPVVTDLFTPGGLAFGADGAVYISQGSVLAGGGTVWRFVL